MKMTKAHYEELTEAFRPHTELLQAHKAHLEETRSYVVLEDRLAWDAYRAFAPRELRARILKENHKDAHILTGLKRALKALGII